MLIGTNDGQIEIVEFDAGRADFEGELKTNLIQITSDGGETNLKNNNPIYTLHFFVVNYSK